MSANSSKQLAYLSDISLQDVMATEFLRLSPDTDVLSAVQKLADSPYALICIVEGGHLRGLFTNHELKRCVAENSQDLVSIKLQDVMSTDMFTMGPEQRLDEALIQMKAHRIQNIPIVSRAGELVGLVTIQHALDSFDDFTDMGGKDASLDPVTKLYNIRFFHQYLDVEIARSVRYGYMFSLFCIEIDNYEEIARDLDREQRTLWLRTFSQMLKFAVKKADAALFVRRSDVAVRWSESQFMLILPETKKEGAFICAERLFKVLSEKINAELKEVSLPSITISLGIVEFPSDATKALMLIEKAKDALQIAKNGGGNRINCYEAFK